jgi:DUF971 family protein
VPAHPTGVNLDVGANLLEISWADGLVSRYGGGYLRHACPCADCRGHVPGEKEPPPWEQVKDVRVSHVEAVGSYALRFTLSDGHSTGIYTYDFLREVSPKEGETGQVPTAP